MKASYEVEVKVRVKDATAIEQVVLRAGGHRLNSEIQTDMYYDHPCRSFSQTDEAVRIRAREAVDNVPLSNSGYAPMELTYKGPKVDKTTKTRLEYTTGITDLDATISILHHTGFRHVTTIKKHRLFFDIKGTTVSIDDVDDVGLFIELEILAGSKRSMEAARNRVISLVRQLGLDPDSMIRESYLELYLGRVAH